MPLDGRLSDYTPVIPAQAPDKDAEILLRAAEIAEDHWGQGAAHPKGGCAPGQLGTTCLMLALRAAYHEITGRSSFRDDVQLCRLVGFNNDLAAFRWNDHPERRLPEVIARLRSAARG